MSEGNGFATAKDIFDRDKRRYREQEIDGLKCRLHSLSELEKSRFEESNKGRNGQPKPSAMIDIRCRMMIAAMVDADGRQLFSPGDINQLRRLDGRLVERISTEIMRHVGWTQDDVDSLVEGAEKNLPCPNADVLPAS